MQVSKKYTPVPWVLDMETSSKFPCHIEDGEGNWLAQFWGKRETEFVAYDAEEAGANARVMLAAPELVEALIEQAKTTAREHFMNSDAILKNDEVKHRNGMYPDPYSEKYWHEYLTDTARAALVKAGILIEGE